MRIFVVFFVLFTPFIAYGVTCPEAGQFLSDNEGCVGCNAGGYCPADSDEMFECPPDNTDWNTLLEECGYHPLEEIKNSDTHINSWSCGPAAALECRFCGDNCDIELGDPYDISQCRVLADDIRLKEGVLAIFQHYNSASGDYWNGCDHLNRFYSANAGYYLSTYTYTRYQGNLYNYIKPCTNAPDHAHYTGPGTPDDPVESGGKTDYNDCPWECDDGYTLQDGACLAPFCPAGYYRPTADSECTACPNGYYCPGDDNSDDAIACPADTTDWNTLLEGCGYHPLAAISTYLSSWSGATSDAAYHISRCFAIDISSTGGVELQEGTLHLEQSYDPQRQDYWHGCDKLHYFYSANTGYYLSDYYATTFNTWYNQIKQCTNAPDNAHYTGPGTPDAIDGSFTDKNDCPWECDDGYGLHDGACMPLCRAGATKFHVGDYVFNIYKEKLTNLAINIGLGDGAVCYVPIVEGSGKGALNVDYKGTVYHTSN